MKKFMLILIIAFMVVTDLILSGQSVIMGLIILAIAALSTYALSMAKQQGTCCQSAQKEKKWDSKYVTKQLSTTFSA